MYYNLLVFFGMMLSFGIAPGPDLLVTVQTALKQGYKRALQVTAGICVSGALWGVLAATGLAALMAKSPEAFNILKWAGALYLAYLGAQAFFGAYKKFKDKDASKHLKDELEAPIAPMTSKQAYIKGFLTDFCSPETAVFIVSFYPQFIPHGASVPLYLTILTALQILSIIVIFVPLSYASSKSVAFLSHPRVMQGIDILSGLFFVFLAYKLLFNTSF